MKTDVGEAWHPIEEGATIGRPGSEDGITIRDDEHPLGARITLEEKCRHCPFTITCGIYGWMCHTRFLGDLETAEKNYHEMKNELVAILLQIPFTIDPESERKSNEVCEKIAEFVARFP